MMEWVLLSCDSGCFSDLSPIRAAIIRGDPGGKSLALVALPQAVLQNPKRHGENDMICIEETAIPTDNLNGSGYRLRIIAQVIAVAIPCNRCNLSS